MGYLLHDRNVYVAFVADLGWLWLLTEAFFPYIWNALASDLKLWYQMRHPDLAPEELEKHEKPEQPL